MVVFASRVISAVAELLVSLFRYIFFVFTTWRRLSLMLNTQGRYALSGARYVVGQRIKEERFATGLLHCRQHNVASPKQPSE